jgi:hypothetical protein
MCLLYGLRGEKFLFHTEPQSLEGAGRTGGSFIFLPLITLIFTEKNIICVHRRDKKGRTPLGGFKDVSHRAAKPQRIKS